MKVYNQPPEPVRTVPTTEPTTAPMRRLEPARICPAQRGRVAERVRRELTRP